MISWATFYVLRYEHANFMTQGFSRRAMVCKLTPGCPWATRFVFTRQSTYLIIHTASTEEVIITLRIPVQLWNPARTPSLIWSHTETLKGCVWEPDGWSKIRGLTKHLVVLTNYHCNNIVALFLKWELIIYLLGNLSKLEENKVLWKMKNEEWISLNFFWHLRLIVKTPVPSASPLTSLSLLQFLSDHITNREKRCCWTQFWP